MKSIPKAEARYGTRLNIFFLTLSRAGNCGEIGNRRREALRLKGFIGSHDKKAKFKRKTAGSTAVIGFSAFLGSVPGFPFFSRFPRNS